MLCPAPRRPREFMAGAIRAEVYARADAANNEEMSARGGVNRKGIAGHGIGRDASKSKPDPMGKPVPLKQLAVKVPVPSPGSTAHRHILEARIPPPDPLRRNSIDEIEDADHVVEKPRHRGASAPRTAAVQARVVPATAEQQRSSIMIDVFIKPNAKLASVGDATSSAPAPPVGEPILASLRANPASASRALASSSGSGHTAMPVPRTYGTSAATITTSGSAGKAAQPSMLPKSRDADLSRQAKNVEELKHAPKMPSPPAAAGTKRARSQPPMPYDPETRTRSASIQRRAVLALPTLTPAQAAQTLFVYPDKAAAIRQYQLMETDKEAAERDGADADALQVRVKAARVERGEVPRISLITITAGDVRRTEDPIEYMNDSLVDWWLAYQYTRVTHDQAHRNSMYFMSSLFYKRLASAAREEGRETYDAAYTNVVNWTKGLDIFEKQYVLIPVVISMHWSMVIVCNLPGVKAHFDARHAMHTGATAPVTPASALPVVVSLEDSVVGSSSTAIVMSLDDDDEDDDGPTKRAAKGKRSHRSTSPSGDDAEAEPPASRKRARAANGLAVPAADCPPCIVHLDSLGSHNIDKISMEVRQYLLREWQRKHNGGEKLGGSTSTYTVADDVEFLPVVKPTVPRQHNSWDCGVFMLQYVQIWLRATAPRPAVRGKPDGKLHAAGGVTRELQASRLKGVYASDTFSHDAIVKLRATMRALAFKLQEQNERDKPLWNYSWPRGPRDEDDDTALALMVQEQGMTPPVANSGVREHPVVINDDDDEVVCIGVTEGPRRVKSGSPRPKTSRGRGAKRETLADAAPAPLSPKSVRAVVGEATKARLKSSTSASTSADVHMSGEIADSGVPQQEDAQGVDDQEDSGTMRITASEKRHAAKSTIGAASPKLPHPTTESFLGAGAPLAAPSAPAPLITPPSSFQEDAMDECESLPSQPLGASSAIKMPMV